MIPHHPETRVTSHPQHAYVDEESKNPAVVRVLWACSTITQEPCFSVFQRIVQVGWTVASLSASDVNDATIVITIQKNQALVQLDGARWPHLGESGCPTVPI